MINDDLSKKKSRHFREKYFVLSYLKSDCAVTILPTGQEKSERKLLKLAERKKKTAFNSKETAERMRRDIQISGCPVYTCPKSTGTSG